MSPRWCVGVDIGGTFTDIVAIELATSETRYLKVPSSRTDPASAVLAGIAALRDEEGIPPDQIGLVLHGTTLATNAIIERELPTTAVVTTAGFRDILEIGRTWRSELYDPFYTPPAPLVDRSLRFEVSERLDARGEVVEPLADDDIERLIAQLRDAGVSAIAIALLHSYANPAHEHLLARRLSGAGDWYVSDSASLMREVREYERTATTVLNASLMPIIDQYLEKLEKGLSDAGVDTRLLISQSNGGLQTPKLARERPVTLGLSGPVAGVVALQKIAQNLQLPNLIGLDMGGTSADISIVSQSEPRVTTELSIGDLPVRLPSIKVDAIGAGGGSIAYVEGGVLRVGPRSAGSRPGPAAYGNGGSEPTVTDAQVMLGRLPAGNRLAGRLTLHPELAEKAITDKLAAPLGMPPEQAAAGLLKVVNASMEGAVRVALRQHGDDARDFALVAFGGAGALHACELARSLGIATVIVPPHPGTLCATGLLSSDLRVDAARSEVHAAGEDGLPAKLESLFDELAVEVLAKIEAAAQDVTLTRWCDVRYPGQAYEVLVPLRQGRLTDETLRQLVADFHQRHEQAYGFSEPGETCELVTFRVAARQQLHIPDPRADVPAEGEVSAVPHQAYDLARGDLEAALYSRDHLPVGYEVQGPAVIQQRDSTTWLPPYARARVAPSSDLIIAIDPEWHRR